MKLTVVVPALNDAAHIVATLTPLASLRARGVEVLVADGGSTDNTVTLARPWADKVFPAPQGRARQLNAGAARARGDVLLFLHADTRLPPKALQAIKQAVADGHHWGRFDVRVDGQARLLHWVASLMNRHSRLSGLASVDQAIFVTRKAFQRVGGFPDRPHREDVDLSRRLRRLGRPACLDQTVRTTGWRWQQRGLWRTLVLAWQLRRPPSAAREGRRLARPSR
jgi:rSAM/selenodomain-associated transferase 2